MWHLCVRHDIHIKLGESTVKRDIRRSSKACTIIAMLSVIEMRTCCFAFQAYLAVWDLRLKLLIVHDTLIVVAHICWLLTAKTCAAVKSAVLWQCVAPLDQMPAHQGEA